jgi:hypothetical protein
MYGQSKALAQPPRRRDQQRDFRLLDKRRL